MPVINRIAEFHEDMTAWRRDIHAHPETAFEEVRTADVVAGLLEGFGIEVHRGLAVTGVVGTLKSGDGKRHIGLRADLDAMHACGHDGHTAMLLGAAKYLAETKNFDGTIHFIFQPAEENEGGGRVMVEDGLFDLFPCEEVYGLHNAPGIPVGEFAVREGPFLAAFDIFEVTVNGIGTHAAMPERGIDPMIPAAQIVSGLQAISSRETSPLQSAVAAIPGTLSLTASSCAVPAAGSTRMSAMPWNQRSSVLPRVSLRPTDARRNYVMSGVTPPQ
jgi:amidohydrolase